MNQRKGFLVSNRVFRFSILIMLILLVQVSVGMRIDEMLIKGKYTMSTWLSRQAGDFNVTLTNVTVQGIASLEVNRGGQLEAQDINMDITFQSIAMNFQNLGFMGTIFQGIINSVGTFLFDSVKPFILSEVNTNVRGDVNKHIMEIPQRFPNSIPPLDMAIAEARKYVRDEGYDPYKIPDYNHTAGLFTIYLRHIWLTGLASFHRVGNVSVVMEKNVVHVGMNIGTQRLKGSCLWEVGVAGLVSRAGSTSFTVEYIQAEFTVAQPLDVRKRPVLEDLNLRLGNIQMRVDGAGTADYIMEFVVNIIPNLLRYQIVDAIENPLKQRIQAILDQIDVEKLVEENLPQVDELAGAKDLD